MLIKKWVIQFSVLFCWNNLYDPIYRINNTTKTTLTYSNTDSLDCKPLQKDNQNILQSIDSTEILHALPPHPNSSFPPSVEQPHTHEQPSLLELTIHQLLTYSTYLYFFSHHSTNDILFWLSLQFHENALYCIWLIGDLYRDRAWFSLDKWRWDGSD